MLRSLTAVVLFFSSSTLAAPWDDNIRIRNSFTGGGTGTAFSLLAEQGTMVKNVRVWREPQDRQFLRGIDVTYTDNKKASIGSQEKEAKDFTFEPDEVITAMSLWGDGVGTKTGRIYFKTSKGREFLQGKDQPEPHQKEFAMDVGSGILVGFEGNSGADIDNLAPIFLKTMKERRIEDLKVEKFDLLKTGLELETLDTAEFRFGGVKNKAKFGNKIQRTVSTAFEDSTASAVSAGFSVSGEVPLLKLASVEVSAGWEMTKTSSQAKTTSKTKELGWDLEVELDGPEDSCRCTAQTFKGELDLSYTGTLVLVTESDGEFKIPTSGRFKQVDASKVIASCESLDGGKAAENVSNMLEGGAPVGQVAPSEAESGSAAPSASASSTTQASSSSASEVATSTTESEAAASETTVASTTAEAPSSTTSTDAADPAPTSEVSSSSTTAESSTTAPAESAEAPQETAEAAVKRSLRRVPRRGLQFTA